MISAYYLRELIEQFVPPPHSRYQEGYLAALQALLRVAEAQS
jgi:hypothetical protein